MTDQNAYFNKGSLRTAFVYSAPGRHEADENRPVAKGTGRNLEYALSYLNRQLPSKFASTDRYAYRITNAFSKPLWKSQHDRSEATADEILCDSEVARVRGDLDGCDLVILCGEKPKILETRLQRPGRTVVCMPHTSVRALVGRYKRPKGTGSQVRATAWAEDLLNFLKASGTSA